VLVTLRIGLNGESNRAKLMPQKPLVRGCRLPANWTKLTNWLRFRKVLLTWDSCGEGENPEGCTWVFLPGFDISRPSSWKPLPRDVLFRKVGSSVGRTVDRCVTLRFP
jgi:hypothetical protein